jgi:hypothetical protein
MINKVQQDYKYKNDDGSYDAYYYGADDAVDPLSLPGRLSLMLLAVALAGFAFLGILCFLSFLNWMIIHDFFLLLIVLENCYLPICCETCLNSTANHCAWFGDWIIVYYDMLISYITGIESNNPQEAQQLNVGAAAAAADGAAGGVGRMAVQRRQQPRYNALDQISQ